MQSSIRFVVRTLVYGVLFLAPLLLLGVLLYHTIVLLGKVLHPIATFLPIPERFGLAASDVIALIALVVLSFLAGLVAQTTAAIRTTRAIEQLILSKMPGYTLFKSVAAGAAGFGGTDEVKVALANIDDAWLMSFIIEKHSNGMLTVFVPSAPTPTAGSIYLLTERQVKRLDISISAAAKCIMQLGVGSKKLFEGKIEGLDET